MVVMDWKAIVGANIRRHRLERDLSQEEVAFRVHITPSYFGQIERAKRNVSIEVLGRIADAIGVPIERLLERVK
jgi:transcriptional regulator with XRE-family HTH domain